MHTDRRTKYLCIPVVAAAALVGARTAGAYTAPYTTPEGITLVDVSKLMDEGSPQFLWRRLGDAHGNPLYTFDGDAAGQSNCYDECAREFPPYAVGAGAKASGEWTIVRRADHVRQWAYQGKPLYRYSGTDPRGEPQGARFQLKEDPAWHDPGSSVYSPKTGWRRAAFAPESSIATPNNIQLMSVAAASGVALVDTASHMTIYTAPVSAKLSSQWQPVYAAAIALPVRDFKIISRKVDGTRQWTFHGEALYTYLGDVAPGEVTGVLVAPKGVKPALVYRDYIPPGVELNQYPGRGPLMTTSKGRTLYTVARFHATYGGREALGGYAVSYNELKSQGTIGCQGDCTETWKPVLASNNAQGQGFWEVIERPGGQKQWMYKGSPVYTYIGDSKPGDIDGNNRHVIVYGGPSGTPIYLEAETDPRTPAIRAGTLTMVAAVGAKPGERGTYVAGQGFVAQNASVAARPAANGANAGANAARRNRLPDHGAGFYWHIVQPF